ncbi:MAG: aspartyl/glutamyl-tRNA amidotransferase subunit A [Candidatus Schekmanbacteria bacterium RBG_16_38_11]|uniref:Glutamyl-tRNA(Gln) amidotransferase subunit A n=1 Tax=Candidatus Schekmanbacteria bacterium RBG_16_38_11 TaxID=1817880 RepID=A0A1F7RVL3_9BACT|nr:MAG: aspartyl/glutamyl-tRNA amidotransferase subunit A [Candidatus Schekmanbacteria bacterium RBG_16_38_11]
MELYSLSILNIHRMLEKKEVSVKEVTQSVLGRIKKVEEKVNAYVTVLADNALEKASLLDEKIKSEGVKDELFGIPLAIKDNMCIKDVLTTCSSKILSNFIPPYNATVIEKLKGKQGIFIGKTNMDEFAMGSSTENSFYVTTKNPWKLDRIPGGSSGGSAAAVAADMCIAALGSDTGGSIRQPAACCGVVGLKPTYGLVSRFGLVAFASSLDQIGPITKDVNDCAIMLSAIAGHDPMDSTSVPKKSDDYLTFLTGNIKGIKVGMPKEYFIKGLDKEVESSVKDAIKKLEENGAEIIDISLPHTEYAVSTYYIIATAEASSNLARYDGIKYGYQYKGSKDLLDMYCKTRSHGFGAEVKRRIMLGTYVLSSGYYDAYYRKAQKVRTLIKEDFDKAFEKVDVIATPTAPTTAFKIGEKADDPLQMYLSDIFTISVNLGGVPAISIPCGFDREGLPVGFQLIGKHFDEGTILNVAYCYEKATDWHKRKPEL